MSGGERAQPFYCPYCGEQEIRPAAEGGERTYECELCTRTWKLEYVKTGGLEDAIDQRNG